MGEKATTIRLQALDGTWETAGPDRARGIWPDQDSVSLTSDRGGSAKASFDLHRAPGRPWPDIGAFTPVEVEVGGVVVWTGRVNDTPARDGAEQVLSVQCEGWQAHLDDDVYERKYVHMRLGDWKDSRSFIGADLTRYIAAAQVTSDRGITIGWANGAAIATNDAVGVTLDMGPGQGAAYAAVTWDKNIGDSAIELYVRSSESENAISSTDITDAFHITPYSTAAGLSVGSFATARRYVTVFLVYTGGGGTFVADQIVKLTDIKIFADAAYQSAGVSVLDAPTVIADAIDRATVLLDPDRSQIDTTATYPLPEWAPTQPQNPREVIQAVNAINDYVAQVDVRKRIVYKAKPEAARFEVGEWSPMETEDASANSGDDVYNAVLIEASTPDGAPVRVRRTASQQPGVALEPYTGAVADNPSFATNTTSWTSTYSGSITRDTVTFDTGAASGYWDLPGGYGELRETFTGTFRAGVAYGLTIRIRAGTGAQQIAASFGVAVPGGDFAPSVQTIDAGLGWQTVTLTWTPTADRTSGVVLLLQANDNTYNIDSLSLSSGRPTIVDRRGFRRTKTLPISTALPIDGAVGARIGDLWLAAHKTSPFKGTAKLTGPSAVRDILTGADVPLERLLLNTMELLRFSDRVDPDTGSHCRDGRLAQVTYTPGNDEAQITIDNGRAEFEALLARFGLVTGAGT